MKTNKSFEDIYGDIFVVNTELGRGGQGIVYRAKDDDYAIKVRIDSNGNEIFDDKFQEKIKNILRLPLRDINEIVLPAQSLKEYSGYIMPLLSDMKEIKNLLEMKNYEHVPEWLAEVNNKDAVKLFTNFYYTGSLKRRIELLMKISAVLMQLHHRGFVYCDISLNNILYTTQNDKVYVCFIDADNIIFNDKVSSAVYTPRYGAPELISHKGKNSILSDCFSFAVAAFHILAYNHPFEGRMEEDDTGNWSNTDNSQNSHDENIFKRPWIYNEDDDSNRAENGLPIDLILDDKLKYLFNKMFTEGVYNITKRPVMAEFYYAFTKAYNKIITCTHCGMTYYYDNNASCPYCEKENKNIITIQAINKNTNKVISCFYETYKIGEQIKIPYSAFMDYTVSNIYDDALIINMEENYMEIRKTSNIFSNLNNIIKIRENIYNKLENKSKTILFKISR